MTDGLKHRKHTKEEREKIANALKGNKNGTTHGLYSKHPELFGVYGSMKNRCYNPNRENYERYGGRGITVCEEWLNSPERFVRWAIANGYKKGMQLDRINNDKGYSPSNCRWVTPKENSRNRRNTKFLTLYGETKSVAEWCETIPVSANTIYWWYRSFGREEAEKRTIEAIEKSCGAEVVDD